ncbi:hypothetical protein [Streptomyces chromofuscus]|uniref:DUF4352 domain-containing protein n=1 Tax=Streptomyces chromofuscus TaxID=42881 RepID=A0A7M2T722_STRCW|nr:hypothetical protein [Streptomyces chromofuscus]QOV44034.1 hypothetical protein IPT68_30940 [Streptomyces chromofuscus]GGT06210.1 hypothetical protein GCM10010254_28300 [Streptomyces chromofuscus]
MRLTMPSGTPEGIPLTVMPFREDAVIGTMSLVTLVRLVPSPRQEEDPRALEAAQPSAGRKPSWCGARLTHGASTLLALIAVPLARARRTVLAVAATAVGCSLCACSTTGGTQTDTAPPAATVSASQDTQSAEGAQDTQDDSDSDTFTVALDKTATWNNGVKAHLSGFSRGTSGEYASPSGKAYLAFSVTMQNGSKSTIDLSMVSLSCPDGAEEIFDTDAGFSGTPDTHLLPGKSQTWKAACVFPKTARSAQIEITPTDTSGSGWYRTAIFTGQVQ